MKGMLIKDLLVSRRTVKTYLVFLLGYLCLSLVGGFGVTLCIAMSQVVVMMLPIASFSFDETAKWGRYAAALPGGRRRMVQGRYSFALLLMLIVSAYNLAVCVIMSILGKVDLAEGLGTVLGAGIAGLLILSIMLPLCFHLGVERARPFLYLIILAPTVVGFLLAQLGVFDGLPLAAVTVSMVMAALAGLLVLACGGFLLSYLVSRRIVERKEY